MAKKLFKVFTVFTFEFNYETMNRMNHPLCVFQVLLKCLMVLQEIPAALKQKRPVATTESLYHMVACITHYVAKVIRVLTTFSTTC